MKALFARRWVMSGMLLLIWAWGAVPAEAQTPVIGRAEIVAVLGAGKGAQFSLPQVRLANEQAAASINRTIAHAVVSQADEPVDTTAALPRQLRQIAGQPCCLRGGRFQTLLNQGNLLSLKLTLEFHGAYYYERAVYLVFDLSSGQRLTLAALVADPPALLARRLEGAVNRRIGEFLSDTATGEHAGRAGLAERFGWDFATRRVRFSTADAPTEIPAPDLGDFALTPHTLLLFYRVGLPSSMLADTPDDTYRFPYARLQARGRLAELVQKSTPVGR